MAGTLNDLLGLIKEFLIVIGIENWLAQIITGGLAFLFLLIFLFKQISQLIKFIVKRHRNKILAKDLNPFYSNKEIENATKYYVKTMFQNVSPSEDEEPGRSYIAAARQPLISLFLNKAFRNDSDDTKYYLILADSGMGKTTFMINLYLAYKFKIVWFWQRQKFNIKLFPLGNTRSLERIKNMSSEEKENTILLLDAFDEDNNAVENYKKRLKEILDIIWEFREIVITCRTQFFPTSQHEPVETGKFKFGPDSGQYIFQKIYLSVFNETDIRKYLKNRFGSIIPFKSSEHIKALSIVLKSPNLMMRPMLLSHIEDLVNVDKEIKFSFQVYETLIDEWLKRESNKAGIIKKYGTTYKQMLYDFSKALARYIHTNRKFKGSSKLSLKVNEIIDNPDGLQLSDIEGNLIEIDRNDQSSRSLLNRNAVGEYKFSHKSIFEYFLALEVFTNQRFRENFYFDSGLDTSKKFFMEMLKFDSINNPKWLGSKLSKLGLSNEEIIKCYDISILRSFRSMPYKRNYYKDTLKRARRFLIFIVSGSFLLGFISIFFSPKINYLLFAIIILIMSFIGAYTPLFLEYYKTKKISDVE